MKTFAVLLFATAMLAFYSCEEKDKKNEHALSGKVYMSSEGMDSLCNIIPLATDYYETIIFLNDSEFLHLLNTCCGDDVEDFAYEYVTKGKYKLDEKLLKMNFDVMSAVCYSKFVTDSLHPDLSVNEEHVELEKTAISSESMVRLNCMEIPYFIHLFGETEREFMSPTTFSVDTYKKELEQNGAWKTLFPGK